MARLLGIAPRGLAALASISLLVLLLLVAGAEAGGRALDGRQAPDLQFQMGVGGFESGARLSAFRGRPVFLMFWLKDCPHCARELPRVQELHDRYGRMGLQVFTVVHEHRPPAVRARLQQGRYDFPVACDLDGSQARRYGVGRRPATYLIGGDGRVMTSNRAPDGKISEALGRYRLARVGTLPASLAALRDPIYQGRMGTALKGAEQAARAAGAGADVKAAAAKVHAVAKEVLDARLHWIRRLVARGKAGRARAEALGVSRAFAGTSLAQAAKAAEAAAR